MEPFGAGILRIPDVPSSAYRSLMIALLGRDLDVLE